MIFLDIETYSTVDLKKAGAYRYAVDPSTEILMIAIDTPDGAIMVSDYGFDDIKYLLAHYEGELVAHNANFERLLFKHVWGIDIPINQWIDTQAMAYRCSFSGDLGEITKALGLTTKSPEGKRLINTFCKPAPKNRKLPRYTKTTNPQDWSLFKEYCGQDVEATRELYYRLLEHDQDDAAIYELDSRVNDRGVPLDITLVEHAIEIADSTKGTLLEAMNDITELINSGSNIQLQEWLVSQGVETDNMQKATIEALLDGPLPGGTRTVLELKQEYSKTSVKKFDAMKRANIAGRLHGMFQYAGASRTNRWAGRLVQLQNLARPTVKDLDLLANNIVQIPEMFTYLYEKPMTSLSSAIRPALCAPDGKLLVVSDLSSIESRLLGWMTNCEKVNDLFAEGKDTYKDMATSIFHVPYDKVTKEQRTLAKPVCLGGGYQLGGKGLKTYAEGFGVSMDEKTAQMHISHFRERYWEIPRFWYWIKDAVFEVVTNNVKVSNDRCNLNIFMEGEFLCIQLPNGRKLYYHKPEIKMVLMPWGEKGEAFTFMGTDSMTHKWTRISAHAGFLTENCTQALARDVLCEWLLRADKAGLNVIGHVHDEIICEEDADQAEHKLSQLSELIRNPIPWARGLLLDADGYTSRRYKK